MKKNAFTLLELLGVVIILGVLTLITFPIILNQIKDAKQGIKDSTKTLIIDAAKDYYEDNTNNFEKIEGITYCIDIKTLTDENYLRRNLKNENRNNIHTNKKVKLIFHNNKFNYEIVDSCTHYTVTFDANGGSVDIDSKEVIENSVYGTLPTPTRAGYTFMGWNGKNLLNIDKMTNDALINNNDGTYTIWYKSTGRYSEYFDVDIPENTKLIMNYELLEYNGTYPAPLQIVGTGDGNAFYISNKNSVKNVNINISKIRIYQEGTQPIGTYTKFKNLQLEEGNVATEYEPYFVTSKTKVTRNFNHTLKAIWKENE